VCDPRPAIPGLLPVCDPRPGIPGLLPVCDPRPGIAGLLPVCDPRPGIPGLLPVCAPRPGIPGLLGRNECPWRDPRNVTFAATARRVQLCRALPCCSHVSKRSPCRETFLTGRFLCPLLRWPCATSPAQTSSSSGSTTTPSSSSFFVFANMQIALSIAASTISLQCPDLHWEASATCHPGFATYHPGFATCHPGFAAWHPGFAAWQPASPRLPQPASGPPVSEAAPKYLLPVLCPLQAMWILPPAVIEECLSSKDALPWPWLRVLRDGCWCSGGVTCTSLGLGSWASSSSASSSLTPTSLVSTPRPRPATTRQGPSPATLTITGSLGELCAGSILRRLTIGLWGTDLA